MTASPPESARSRPWARLGRLLPATLRQRVFEPAYYDLLATRPRRHHRDAALGFRVLMLALETYRVGAPRWAWARVRASRRLQVALAILLVLVTAYAVLLASYDPPTYAVAP